MSDLNVAFKLLKTTFEKYAGKDGDGTTLSKRELTELLHHEFELKGCSHSEEVCRFFSALDHDGDGVVDFNEYVISVVALAMMAYQE